MNGLTTFADATNNQRKKALNILTWWTEKTS